MPPAATYVLRPQATSSVKTRQAAMLSISFLWMDKCWKKFTVAPRGELIELLSEQVVYSQAQRLLALSRRITERVDCRDGAAAMGLLHYRHGIQFRTA